MNIHLMKIYKESFHDVRSHKREWMRVAYGPLLVWVLGALFLALAYVSGGHVFEMHKAYMEGTYSQVSEGSVFLSIAHIVYGITYFIAMTSLYINGYRYAVLRDGGDRLITLNLNIRFVKMVLYSILIGILAIIYAGVSAGIIYGAHTLFENTGVNVILGILLSFYGFYLLFRILLYPVLISIDQSEPVKTSWNLMKGNILRFIGLALLVALTIFIIGLIGGLAVLILGGLFSMISPVLGVLALFLGVIFIVFMVLFGWAVNSKMMGLVYQELSNTSNQ